MGDNRIIRAVVTVLIFCVVFIVLAFGNILVQDHTNEYINDVDSTVQTDTKHTETADLQKDAADTSSNDSETTVDDTVCDTQGSADNSDDSGSASYTVAEPEKDIFTENKPAANSIGFGDYNENFYLSSIKLYDPDILTGYTPKYSECNSYILYSSLKTEQERLIYHALEYAYDHQYGTVFFSKDLIGDGIDLERIFRLYLLDSPMMEENRICYCLGEPDNHAVVTYKYTLSGGGICSSNMFGYAIAIKNFQICDPDKYAAAYNKAREIVASVPSGLGTMQKAEYLYRYLCTHVTYQDKDNGLYIEQLYDALILGKCVCDGFANSLLLFYNLAGIPCFEKEYIPESGSGHVWICFSVDGVWYNADPTCNSDLNEESVLGMVLNGFGFSDKYQMYPHDYGDIMPKCTADTLYANREYLPKSTDSYTLLGAIIQSWRDSGETVGCVITDKMTDEELAVLQENMSCEDRIPEVDAFFLYKISYLDCEALIFLDSTDHQ